MSHQGRETTLLPPGHVVELDTYNRHHWSCFICRLKSSVLQQTSLSVLVVAASHSTTDLFNHYHLVWDIIGSRRVYIYSEGCRSCDFLFPNLKLTLICGFVTYLAAIYCSHGRTLPLRIATWPLYPYTTVSRVNFSLPKGSPNVLKPISSIESFQQFCSVSSFRTCSV